MITPLMIDDYRHRWKFIHIAAKGIYNFFRITLYEIPKFFFATLPWEIIKALKAGAVDLYRAIPPIKEWPGIISRALISMAKTTRNFLIAFAKGIKASPKILYNAGAYIVKKSWKGIKAIPHLVKKGAEKTWSGLKVFGSWIRDLLLRFVILYI
jgi:hypothetical protein